MGHIGGSEREVTLAKPRGLPANREFARPFHHAVKLILGGMHVGGMFLARLKAIETGGKHLPAHQIDLGHLFG